MFHKWSLNMAILAGKVGKDPVIRTGKGGTKTSFAYFPLATKEEYKSGRERTNWHDITAWGPTFTSLCENKVKKGMPIIVTGTIQQNVRPDENGKKRKYTNIRAENIIFFCPKTKEEVSVSENGEEDEFFDKPASKEDDKDGLW